MADGSVVTARADENPDLYWGLRGAGANFGVVTKSEFATQVVAQNPFRSTAHCTGWTGNRSTARSVNDHLGTAPKVFGIV